MKRILQQRRPALPALLRLAMAVLVVLALATFAGASLSPALAVNVPQCEDGLDNDGDGLVDHPQDPGCNDPSDNDEYNSPPPPPPAAQCSDGADNDGDGAVDYPNDPGCSSSSDDDEYDAPPPPPPPRPQCENGVDDDGDGLVDYPNDPGCAEGPDTDEYNSPPSPPPSAAQCGDGADNDGDGAIDYPNDPGCSSTSDGDEYNAPPPPPPAAQCSDGADNDGDGAVDYPNDPDCTSAADTDEYSTCDEYDPERDIWYICTPDQSGFYTPDGIDPDTVSPEAGGGCNPYTGGGYCAASREGATNEVSASIPPPAPYQYGKDYCSYPDWYFSFYAGTLNRTCYRHDVCYGSQLGRGYCDSYFWKDGSNDCRRAYNADAWRVKYDPRRYDCLSDVAQWYLAIRAFGGSHYKPRTTSREP